MFYTIKFKPHALLVPTSLLVLLLLFCRTASWQPVLAPGQSSPCLIIDPGHGGRDGGAVSFAGDKESDINLAIALRLHQLARLYGVKTQLTRCEDVGYTDLANYSEHEELVHRCDIINSVHDGVLMSIHQNSFPTGQPSGAQVLYASGDESKYLGILTHNNITQFLEPGNRRVAEPAPGNLFITANARCPSILVECGFMSNLSDLQKLKDQNYQTAFSTVLFLSFLQYREAAEQG